MRSIHDDLERWRDYVARIHARHSPGRRRDAYTSLQTVVERSGHRMIARGTQGSTRVLEIGIGGGEHLCEEEGSAPTRLYVGVDLSLDHLRIARRLAPCALVQADATRLPFQGGTFDSCIASGVLEHVADLEALLLEVRRILRPGGALHVVVPTNGSLAVGLFKWLVSYPSMLFQGIRRPSSVWHHENVNHFRRVACLLEKHFMLTVSRAIPLKHVPWFLSPLWYFRCDT